MNDAKTITDPQERADAWAEIDKKITELAPAVELGLGQDPADPLGERERRSSSAFLGQWDLSFTSIK